MKIDIQTLDAKKAGSIDLDDSVFGIKETRADILQRMVKYQLAKRRAGTHKTLSRGEVNRTHAKLYKQKGTGQARHGSANAPIFRGGGHAHNRLPRDYGHDLTKKVRAMALKHALSAKVNAGELIVLDAIALKEAKTATLLKHLTALNIDNALFIAGPEVDENFARAAGNLHNIDVLPNAGLNVYDILRRTKLVLTPAAVEAIHARFNKDGEAKAAPKKRASKKTEAEGAAA